MPVRLHPGYAPETADKLRASYGPGPLRMSDGNRCENGEAPETRNTAATGLCNRTNQMKSRTLLAREYRPLKSLLPDQSADEYAQPATGAGPVDAVLMYPTFRSSELITGECCTYDHGARGTYGWFSDLAMEDLGTGIYPADIDTADSTA